jgi:hypothetical protein|tara:strand:+ start:2220 stop:2699 length:480 start_codon:yes stop_codon:yes gene_type:complete
MATFPARPGTALGVTADANGITGAIITSNSGVTGDGNGVFFIKTTSATFSGTVPIVETTGSGDTKVRYDHGDKPYYEIQLQGVMLGDKGLQMKNLVNQVASATGDPSITLSFRFSSADDHRVNSLPVIVTQCQIQFDPKSPVVGVALAMKSMTDASFTI